MDNLIMVNSVQAKTFSLKRRRLGFRTFAAVAAAVVLLAVALTIGYEVNYGAFGIIGPQPSIEAAAGKGRVIRVPPGGNVQTAVDMAQSGDIVELQAGAAYSGTITLPNKPLTDFVTIQSSAAPSLPVDKRVSPSQRASMATITAGMLGRPAVSIVKGAHHYRFVGIEFTASSSTYNYGLVQLGDGEAANNLPHHIEIDRSYVHPFKTGKVRRGIALNSADTVIKNSYIEGFGYAGEETQGICGWSGSRNIKILNNYVEGGAENIMFGGSDPASADLIPQDIEIRGNELNKPRSWVGTATMKTLFELKNAKRVQFVGNRLTNNWVGSAFRMTVRNQDNGANFSTLEDVEIRDNLIDGSGAGVNILGKDDTNPSGTMHGLRIENNLFLNIGGKDFDGNGYLIQASDGDGITIVNNTAFNTGSVVVFHGPTPRNFVFSDNIAGHGDYGIHGVDTKSAAAKTMFARNVFMNLGHVPESDFSFPVGNSIVPDVAQIGFANPAGKDFRLSPGSRYRGKGNGGKNLGSDLPPIGGSE